VNILDRHLQEKKRKKEKEHPTRREEHGNTHMGLQVGQCYRISGVGPTWKGLELLQM